MPGRHGLYSLPHLNRTEDPVTARAARSHRGKGGLSRQGDIWSVETPEARGQAGSRREPARASHVLRTFSGIESWE